MSRTTLRIITTSERVVPEGERAIYVIENEIQVRVASGSKVPITTCGQAFSRSIGWLANVRRFWRIYVDTGHGNARFFSASVSSANST